MSRKVKWEKKGEVIEVRVVDGYRVIEVKTFKQNDDKDNYLFFEYVCDKLGFNMKKYQRAKNIEWQ